MKAIRRHTDASIWTLLDRSDGPHRCWPWLGECFKSGYGKVSWKNKRCRAHRVVYEIAHKMMLPECGTGNKNRALVIIHECHNRICCNPAHLKLGSQSENIKEAFRIGSKRANGENNPRRIFKKRRLGLL